MHLGGIFKRHDTSCHPVCSQSVAHTPGMQKNIRKARTDFLYASRACLKNIRHVILAGMSETAIPAPPERRCLTMDAADHKTAVQLSYFTKAALSDTDSQFRHIIRNFIHIADVIAMLPFFLIPDFYPV